MYLHSLEIDGFRSIRTATLEFHYPGRHDRATPRVKLPNLNLLLGINGAGKTTVLRAAAIAALGPLAPSYVQPERFVREERRPPDRRGAARKRGAATRKTSLPPAVIASRIALTPQDVDPKWSSAADAVELIDGRVEIERRGDEERIVTAAEKEPRWEPVFVRESPAFLVVGYGASRRIEFDRSVGVRMKEMPPRRQRIEGLFQEGYSMIPLNVWLPRYRSSNPGRFRQVVTLLNRLLPKGYRFTEEMYGEDYLFDVAGLRLPLKALSDGYKAFIGWVVDLLYHLNFGCPSGKRLDESTGIVLIDEIDLHLHPEWQLEVVARLAKTLPKLQFILTSHSPLVTGSLEWMNVHYLSSSPRTGATKVERIERPIHGLSADQILTSSFFGLKSTRAPSKRRRLEQMSRKARGGDRTAARAVLDELTRGLEETGARYDDLPRA